MRGAPGTVATGAGTRPGDSVADLLFALAQADFLGNVRSRLRQEGLTEDPLQNRAELDKRHATQFLQGEDGTTALVPRQRCARFTPESARPFTSMTESSGRLMLGVPFLPASWGQNRRQTECPC